MDEIDPQWHQQESQEQSEQIPFQHSTDRELSLRVRAHLQQRFVSRLEDNPSLGEYLTWPEIKE